MSEVWHVSTTATCCECGRVTPKWMYDSEWGWTCSEKCYRSAAAKWWERVGPSPDED